MRCPNRALLWHLNASCQLLRKVFAIVALSVSETYEKIIGRNIFTHQKERGFEMLLDNLTCSVCDTVGALGRCSQRSQLIHLNEARLRFAVGFPTHCTPAINKHKVNLSHSIINCWAMVLHLISPKTYRTSWKIKKKNVFMLSSKAFSSNFIEAERVANLFFLSYLKWHKGYCWKKKKYQYSAGKGQWRHDMVFQ